MAAGGDSQCVRLVDLSLFVEQSGVTQKSGVTQSLSLQRKLINIQPLHTVNNSVPCVLTIHTSILFGLNLQYNIT